MATNPKEDVIAGTSMSTLSPMAAPSPGPTAPVVSPAEIAAHAPVSSAALSLSLPSAALPPPPQHLQVPFPPFWNLQPSAPVALGRSSTYPRDIYTNPPAPDSLSASPFLSISRRNSGSQGGQSSSAGGVGLAHHTPEWSLITPVLSGSHAGSNAPDPTGYAAEPVSGSHYTESNRSDSVAVPLLTIQQQAHFREISRIRKSYETIISKLKASHEAYLKDVEAKLATEISGVVKDKLEAVAALTAENQRLRQEKDQIQQEIARMTAAQASSQQTVAALTAEKQRLHKAMDQLQPQITKYKNMLELQPICIRSSTHENIARGASFEEGWHDESEHKSQSEHLLSSSISASNHVTASASNHVTASASQSKRYVPPRLTSPFVPFSTAAAPSSATTSDSQRQGTAASPLVFSRTSPSSTKPPMAEAMTDARGIDQKIIATRDSLRYNPDTREWSFSSTPGDSSAAPPPSGLLSAICSCFKKC